MSAAKLRGGNWRGAESLSGVLERDTPVLCQSLHLLVSSLPLSHVVPVSGTEARTVGPAGSELKARRLEEALLQPRMGPVRPTRSWFVAAEELLVPKKPLV